MLAMAPPDDLLRRQRRHSLYTTIAPFGKHSPRPLLDTRCCRVGSTFNVHETLRIYTCIRGPHSCDRPGDRQCECETLKKASHLPFSPCYIPRLSTLGTPDARAMWAGDSDVKPPPDRCEGT